MLDSKQPCNTRTQERMEKTKVDNKPGDLTKGPYMAKQCPQKL